MQHQQPTLRELLIQLVNTFKHSFDSSKVACDQKTADVANAKLSQFEKTYVSFPEFVDIGATATTTTNANSAPTDNARRHQPWLQHSSTLTC
ncbi:hypothetical protein G6F42_015681 [Rhizopus arrhizus]|nr:hypothetical protein G6F42_015681 [Rhizopus arrhizus]